MGKKLDTFIFQSSIEIEQKIRGTSLQELFIEIETSRSKESTEDEIVNLLKNTNQTIKEIENEIQDDPNNQELQEFRQKILVEWNELIHSIRSSLKTNRDFTEQELAIIKLEQSNILQITHGSSITSSVLNEAGKLARIIGFNSDDMNIDATKATNQYQEDLLQKILGENYEQGFGNGYLKCFNKEKGGNSILEIKDFEKLLQNTQNFQSINTRGMRSYINFLHSQYPGEEFYNFLKENFGSKKTLDLLSFMERQKEVTGVFFTNVKKSFEQFVDNFVGKIIGSIMSFRSLDELDTLLKSNFETIQNMDGSEKEKFILGLSEELLEKKEELINTIMVSLIKTSYPEKEAKKIAQETVEKIIENLSISNLKIAYQTIQDLNTKHHTNLDTKTIVNKAIEAKAGEIELEKIKLEEAKKNAKTPEEIEKVKIADDKNNQARSEIHALSAFNNILTETQIKEISSEKKTTQELITEIRKENKDFDIYFSQYEQKKAEFEKKYPSSIKKKSEEIKKSSQNLQSNGDQIQTLQTQNELISQDGNYTLKTQKEEISITQKEAKIIENNPEAEKNLINFKNTLDELHISKIWDIRDDIFTVLRDEYPILFNENDTFLSENEVVIFLNSLLVSLDMNHYNSPNIHTLKSHFWTVNSISVLGGTNSENQINGNTSLEQTFMNKFCPIVNNGKFESAVFRKAI